MDIDQNYKRLKHGIIWQYKKVIEKTKNVENIPSLKLVEVVLVKCNLVDNQYQRKSKILYTFTPNKSYT